MSAPAPLLEQRSTAGDNELCHIACNVYEDRTLCGLRDDSATWCPDPNCDKGCVVCADLDESADCSVCGWQCGVLA